MQSIDRAGLRTLLERGEDFDLVEVLGPKDYREFHLPQAINVPFGDDFAERIQSAIGNKSRKVVVYCKDVSCPASLGAARKMEELGYRQVVHYAGGKQDWKQGGLHVVHSML